MADEDKAKAEKLAAAKKRVEQMKKKNAKKGGAAKKDATKESKDEASAAEDAATDEPSEQPTSPTASLSQQSKMRSSSFRQGAMSPSALPSVSSPEGETAPEIYRKQVARIEDLEKENKRLSKEATDSEKRWQKAEEELADLREADGDGNGDDGQIEKLKADIAALERKNSQLQSAATKRHGSSPSISMSSPPPVELQAQLDSKSATIESMELEISRLRAQAEKQASAGGDDREQITALEEKLARTEQTAMKAQRELGDLKRNLERTTERAVKEGSERTSAETKARSLEQELEGLRRDKVDLEKKVDGLEKKVAALGNLHKENDSRSQALRKEKDRAEKDAEEAKSKVEKLESENMRLRKKDAAEGGGNDEEIDELEREERQRMEKMIRDLEAENHELRHGIWHQKRKEMEVGPGEDLASPGGGFTNIDLGSGLASPGAASATRRGTGAGGFGDFFASGLNALTGAGAEEKDEFLDDDDMEFDEDAFRQAQEQEATQRLERIKEIKRGLKNWEGWRLDLVEGRRGGGGYGAGEIFDI